MFLGAGNVCVSPETTFGFHGPFRFGARLSAAEFDEWSNLIASHYPALVKTWYIHKARHQNFWHFPSERARADPSGRGPVPLKRFHKTLKQARVQNPVRAQREAGNLNSAKCGNAPRPRLF
ncbi:hypothetical protein SAMN04488527_10652 [Aliiroseovarius crassostreae]|uniref:Uncharacterized protein n=1 Tax=Aliiroseovarius crassostreae TaxID=154981 RepID=A0A0P7HYG7_9RHOB|nr:hypothetical protein AKJ29_03125 [Aliiroseovarius crassostreae]SFU56352.1 hypothetical protein SAMN04488527_10652 [Aliiroseovarius crassostreae]